MSSILYLIFLLPIICWAKSTNIGVDCIVMPAFPLFGRLQPSGSFVLTLVCPESEMDMPLNSPGDNGILYCDPNKQNYELSEVIVPECVPIRLAKSVHLPLLMVFTIDACVDNFADAVNLYINTYFPKFNNRGPPLEESTWSAPVVICDKNRVFKDGKEFQIDVQFSLVTPYRNSADFQGFAQALEKFRETLILFRQREKLVGHWNGTRAMFMGFDIGMWSAYCKEVASSKGTILALHLVAACRGCSRSYYFSKVDDKCIQCGFNYYTEAPYSITCIQCPDESKWGFNRPEMLMLCYGRM
ncbi:hypothetical protein BgiBS90_009802 [Biomphalaria glabrata]|nr:hypothetical protein BgiBS90_009802 [Biomphalaria glabrata]